MAAALRPRCRRPAMTGVRMAGKGQGMHSKLNREPALGALDDQARDALRLAVGDLGSVTEDSGAYWSERSGLAWQ